MRLTYTYRVRVRAAGEVMTTLGTHVGCGGEVVYTATATRGTRRCTTCGADGQYGRPSPEVDAAAGADEAEERELADHRAWIRAEACRPRP